MTSPLLINEPPLQVLPTLARIIGLNEAIVLQQVHYWLNPDFNTNFFEGKHWVHNTFNQWQKQFFFWSRKTIKRTIASLENSGLLISFITVGFKKTKYYTLDYDLLGRISLPGVHAYSAKTRAGHAPRYETEGPDLKLLENAPENHGDQPSHKKLLMDWPDYTEGRLPAEVQPPTEGPSPSGQDERAAPANYQETAEKQGVHSWGQVDPLDGVNLASPMAQNKPLKLEGIEEMAEKQGSHPWGQNGPLDGVKLTLSIGSKWPSRWGQSGPLDGVKLTPSLYTENTSENTNTTPLLPLPGSSSARSDLAKLDPRSKLDSRSTPESAEAQEDEEENQNKKIKNAGKQPCQEIIPQGTILQQMLDFWNQIVQSKIYPAQEVRLTEKRQQLLGAFLDSVLKEKCRNAKHPDALLDGWRDYCNRIARNKFLAGNNTSGFRVTLDWSLVPRNAWKILKGAIYDKPEPASSPKDLPWEAFSEELARTLPTGKHLPSWLKISIALAKMIGQASYRSWFAKVSLEELTETKAVFSVGGSFTRSYVSAHFSTDILRAVQVLYPKVTQIDFRATDASAHMPSRPGARNQQSGQTAMRLNHENQNPTTGENE